MSFIDDFDWEDEENWDSREDFEELYPDLDEDELEEDDD